MAESIEIIQAMLGLKPFILIECAPDDDPGNEAGFTMNVRAGGGIETNDDMVAVLLLVVEQLTGVDTDLYVLEVDRARRAAGAAPLSQWGAGHD